MYKNWKDFLQRNGLILDLVSFNYIEKTYENPNQALAIARSIHQSGQTPDNPHMAAFIRACVACGIIA